MTSTMDELEGKSSLCSFTTMVYKDWCLTRDFTNNFSKQQAYHFIFNDKINPEMKSKSRNGY